VKRILFVPLDDRPATRETVLDLLPLTGAAWMTPPRDLLGHRRRPADVESLFRWVEREAANADALIASAEVLMHGGLVASRLSTASMDVLWRRLDRLLKIAARVPTYLSAVNPRIPTGGSDEEPGYWGPYGDHLRTYSTALDAAEQTDNADRHAQARAAVDAIPAAAVDDLLRRRRRQVLINIELLMLAGQGAIAALLIGQDDAEPHGFTRADLAVLRRFAGRTGGARAHVSIGADELNARLLARLVVDVARITPRVAVRYTFPEARRSVPRYEPQPLDETVTTHLAAAGCAAVDDDPEIVLWVHNFAGVQQRESIDQRGAPPAPVRQVAAALNEAASRGIVCACADVRFANGADDALVHSLLARENLAGLSGYAGWNTCSNTLGTALAQAVLMHFARARVSEVRIRQIRRRFLTRRLLDDWGYQAVVRPWLSGQVVPSLGGAATDLASVEDLVRNAAIAKFRQDVLPSVERALGPSNLTGIEFPWHRLFEIDVHLPDEAPARV
jgi:hypothetical protein